MPQVTCPQCGAANGTDAPDYPFCAGCQDNLAKCGYCRWFDDEVVVCTNREVAGVFEVAADSTPPCDQHAPRDSMLVPGRGVWPGLVVGLVAALVLAYSLYQFQRPQSIPADLPRETLRLNVKGDLPTAVVGQPYGATVRIRNLTHETVDRVRLQISKESVPARFRLAKMVPQPWAREGGGEWLSYNFADLGPRDTLTISLQLVPRRPGVHILAVRVVSGRTDSQGLMTDLPVQVREAPAEQASGKGGSGP